EDERSMPSDPIGQDGHSRGHPPPEVAGRGGGARGSCRLFGFGSRGARDLALLHFVHPRDGPDSPFVLSVVFLPALLALSQLSAELVLSLPRVSRPGRRDACVVFHDELLYRRESRGIDPVAQLFYLQAIDGPLLHGAAAILLHG